MRRVHRLGLVLFAAWCASSCAEGSSADAPSGARPIDASVDASVDASIEASIDDAAPNPYGDARPLFDAIDDAPCPNGATGACTTTCATPGISTCAAGVWGPCEPLAGDKCSGLDCAGQGDGLEHTYFRDADGDGHGDPASTIQGCAAPSGYVASSDDCDDGKAHAHPGAEEVCDGVDNDCNGKVDELPKVAEHTLAFADVPPCTTSDMASCKRGAFEWCRARSACFTGGFGPVELGPTSGTFVCVGDGTLTSGWADANAAQPACASDAMASKRVCESAVHRAGASKGFVSAILQTHAPGDWQILGLPASRAQAFHGLVWNDLTSKHPPCKPGAEDSWACNAASHRFCQSKGFVSGYGPVEYNPTSVSVVCIKP